jgi:hypothetical protein
MNKYTRNTAYKKERKSHQKKDNIQRKEKHHNTARIKEKTQCSLNTNIRVHSSSRYRTNFYKKEEKLSCLDMAVSRQTAKIEENLKSFP